MVCLRCDDGEGGCMFPIYGLAPHGHDLSRTGSIIGSTVTLPREKWPENFHEDEDEPGLGMFTHCPVCGACGAT